MTSGEANKALVLRFVDEVLNGHRLERLGEFLAPDYVDRSEGLSGAEAIAALRNGFESWWEAFPDHRIEIEQLVAEGDLVASRSACVATHAGSYAGIPATGATVRFAAHELYRIRDRRIVEHWEVWDEFGVLRQLGRFPPPVDAGHPGLVDSRN